MDKALHCPDWPRTHYAAENDLQLLLLPTPPNMEGQHSETAVHELTGPRFSLVSAQSCLLPVLCMGTTSPLPDIHFQTETIPCIRNTFSLNPFNNEAGGLSPHLRIPGRILRSKRWVVLVPKEAIWLAVLGLEGCLVSLPPFICAEENTVPSFQA